MDWTQAVTIILSVMAITGAGFFFLSSGMDRISDKLNDKIDRFKDDLSKDIVRNREEIIWIKFRI